MPLITSTAIRTSLSLAVAGVTLASVAPGAAADIAPNGVIAYSARDDTGYNIYSYDPATPEVPAVALTTDGWSNASPDWSPDGTRIAYESWHRAGEQGIRVMDADPATVDQLTVTEPCPGTVCYGDIQPAWSPDGTRIAFVSSRPRDDGTEPFALDVYVMDATGEVGAAPQAARLTNDPVDEENYTIHDSQVTWSPDGTRVAFVSTGRGEDPYRCDLWSMDAQDLDGDGFGDNLARLTFGEEANCNEFIDLTPSWSPGSSLIAWSSFRNGNWDIWLVNADDPTDLRNVTRTATEAEYEPSFSPDGTMVIFRKSWEGTYQYFSLPVPPPTAPREVVDAEGAGGNDTEADDAGSAARPRPQQLTFGDDDKFAADWGAEEGALKGTVTLAVGARRGSVTADDPTKIDCGKRCVATYVQGSRVELTADPKPGYEFRRWFGACRGSDEVCELRLRTDRKAGARFGPIA